MREVLLVLVLTACEKADGVSPLPAPVVPTPVPDAPVAPADALRYAAKTEQSSAGINDTYFSIVEDDQLFMVGDANGRSNAGDAPKLAAEAMPAALAACADKADDRLACAFDRVNRTLLDARAGITSFSAVIVRERKVIAQSQGDVRVLWIHGSEVDVIASPNTTPVGENERITLVQGAGIVLRPSDAIAIVNRDLYEAVGDAKIQRAVATVTTVEAAVAAIIDEGLAVPKHGPLSVVVVRLVQK